MVKASSSSKATKVSVQGKNTTTSVTVTSKDAIKYTNVQSNSASLFAQQANAYATDAARNANRSKVWAEGSDTEVAELGGEHSSKGWVEQAKNYTKEVQNIQDALLSNTAVATVFNNMEALLDLKESKDNLLEIKNDVETAAQTTTEQADRAERYAEQISQFAEETQYNANMAAVSAGMAANHLKAATEQANIATEKAEVAVVQADNALASEKNAKTSETNALTYSNSALASSTSASNSETQAKIYSQEAKAFRDEAEQIVENASGGSIDESNLVHKDSTETITGPKTFTGAVNLIGSGDSNAVRISTNTRFNVHGTSKTVLGFGSGIFYINHGDYRLRLRGKDTRPHYNSDTNYLALLSDIPDTSNLATKNEIPTDYATKEELNNKQDKGNYLTPQSLISYPTFGDLNNELKNYASKEELNNKQDTLTAGENITIENGVISASGGAEIDTSNLATKTDVANKQDKFTTALPLTMGGLKTSTTNISYDNNGKAYLNDVAYYATLPELLPSSPLIGTNTDIKPSFSADSPQTANPTLRFSKIKGANGDNPILNLDGYNAIIHEFKAGDIVMGDQPCEYANYNDLEMCFGIIENDGTFTPRMYARTYGWGANARWSFISELISPSGVSISKQQQRYSSNYLMTYGTANTNFITLSSKTHANISNMADIYGIKLVERNGGMSFNWVTLDGTEIELSDCGSMDFSGINCVIYKGIVYDVSTATNVTNKGFDPNRYYVANGTIDNVIVRMLDGTGVDSLAIKYSDDFLLNENNEISLNAEKIPTIAIGAIVPVNASTNYVPNGYLPCDGAEYTKAQFSDLWDNYLTSEETELVLSSVVTENSEGIIANNGIVTAGTMMITGLYKENNKISFKFILKDDITKWIDIVATNEHRIYVYKGYIRIINFNTLLETAPMQVTANTEYTFNFECSETSAVLKINDTIIREEDIQFDKVLHIYASEDKPVDLSEGSIILDGVVTPLVEERPLGLLNTCTYSKYEADLATYGQCFKIAVDVYNEKFRVPLIKDTETVVTNNIDYANGIKLSTTLPLEATPYVAPADGLYYVEVYKNNAQSYLYINGVESNYYYDRSDSVLQTPVYAFVKKGDVIYWSATLSVNYSKFYPYKEETKEKLKSFVVVANGQTNQSLMDWSQWASSLQGKANADFSNVAQSVLGLRKLVEVSDSSLMPSWYKVFEEIQPDGSVKKWCEQGGVITPSSTGKKAYNYVKPFADENYLLFKQYLRDTTSSEGASQRLMAIYRVDATSFSNYDVSGTPYSWQAMGYIN
jgi:hypothetical protein